MAPEVLAAIEQIYTANSRPSGSLNSRKAVDLANGPYESGAGPGEVAQIGAAPIQAGGLDAARASAGFENDPGPLTVYRPDTAAERLNPFRTTGGVVKKDHVGFLRRPNSVFGRNEVDERYSMGARSRDYVNQVQGNMWDRVENGGRSQMAYLNRPGGVEAEQARLTGQAGRTSANVTGQQLTEGLQAQYPGSFGGTGARMDGGVAVRRAPGVGQASMTQHESGVYLPAGKNNRGFANTYQQFSTDANKVRDAATGTQYRNNNGRVEAKGPNGWMNSGTAGYSAADDWKTNATSKQRP